MPLHRVSPSLKVKRSKICSVRRRQPLGSHPEKSDRPLAVTGLLIAKHQRKGERGQSLGAKDDVHARVGDNSLTQFTHLCPIFLRSSQTTFIFHLQGKGGVFEGLLHLPRTKHSQVATLLRTAAVTELAGQLLSEMQ